MYVSFFMQAKRATSNGRKMLLLQRKGEISEYAKNHYWKNAFFMRDMNRRNYDEKANIFRNICV